MICNGGVSMVVCEGSEHRIGVGDRDLSLLDHETVPGPTVACHQVVSLVAAVAARWPGTRFSLFSLTAAAVNEITSPSGSEDTVFAVMVGAARRELPTMIVDAWLDRCLPLPEIHSYSEFFGVPVVEQSLISKVDSWINSPLPGTEEILSRISLGAWNDASL